MGHEAPINLDVEILAKVNLFLNDVLIRVLISRNLFFFFFYVNLFDA